MIRLNLPPYAAQVSQQAGKPYIYDCLRRRTVRLTPEEWVRQHFVHYLIDHLRYPPELMMNEVSIRVAQRSKRCDTVIYNRNLRPLVLVEYKAPEVALSERVLQQAIRYNYTLLVPYLILSNGLEHLVYHIDYEQMTYEPLREIPPFGHLMSLQSK